MNIFFRQLPLPVKLMLIGVIPLAFLLYLTMELYQEKTDKVNLLDRYQVHINQSATLTTLIDELQTERKYTYEYAITRKNWKNEMIEQRARTDSLTHKLASTRDPALAGFTSYTFLNNLAESRAKVDSGVWAANQVMHFYTNMIFRLNTLNTVSQESDIYVRPLYQDLLSQKLLSEMITYLGIMRSNIYNVLYTRQYMIETLIGMVGVQEVYKTYETEFLLKGSPQVIEKYKQISNNTELRPTVKYLDSLFTKFTFDSTYTAETWWSVSANGIDELRKLQLGTLQSVQSEMDAIYKKAEREKNQTTLLLILALIFIVAIVSYVIFIINKMLKDIKIAAEKISRGGTGIQFKNIPKDVIGSLSESILRIDENNRELAIAADAIGKGLFEIRITPRSDEDLLGYALGRMKDDLQQFTREIEDSKEQFRQLADSMPQIVWTARPDGYLDYYNRKWYEYTEFNEDYGDPSWIPILHPDDVKVCYDTWYNSVRTGTPYNIEYRFIDRKNPGKYRWFLGRACPVKDSMGNVIKWFGTCTDIDDQKNISQNLEHLVEARTKELSQLNETLEKTNSELEQFAYIASHDLQEPLRKIHAYTEMFLQRNKENITEESRDFLSKITSASHRMTKLINDLLNFSRLSSKEDAFETIDLNKALENILNDFELMIREKNAVINFDQLPAISAIELQMSQLFYNLISNSLKFVKPGTNPVINIRCQKLSRDEFLQFPHLDQRVTHYEIVFRDNGIGFEQEYSKKIFEIFQRLRGRSEFGGSGIGLALCKKIVQNHHGEIFANSKENVGSEFFIILPEHQPVKEVYHEGDKLHVEK